MGECGSCDTTVSEGQPVKKGDQPGIFYFEGFTYDLLFRLEGNVDLDLHGEEPGLEAKNVLFNAKIATVTMCS